VQPQSGELGVGDSVQVAVSYFPRQAMCHRGRLAVICRYPDMVPPATPATPTSHSSMRISTTASVAVPEEVSIVELRGEAENVDVALEADRIQCEPTYIGHFVQHIFCIYNRSEIKVALP